MKTRRLFPILVAGAATGLALFSAPGLTTASAADTTAKPVAATTSTTAKIGSSSGNDNVYTVTGNGVPDTANPGLTLYNQHCSTCHGLNGEGNTIDGRNMPPLINVGAAAVDFYISTGRMPLRAPVDQAPRDRNIFTQEQTDEIVKYVSENFGKGGPEIPEVDLSKGNLVEGNELFANNCAACHNSAGSGGALGGDYYAPNLFEASPTQVAEAVRFGPGAMPIFGEKQMNQEQLDSLVKYVEDLRNADTPGGYPIGKFGPVAEGFVAWVIGLGALLALSRWMGSRV